MNANHQFVRPPTELERVRELVSPTEFGGGSVKPVIRCSQLDQLFECPASYPLQQIVAPANREDSREGTYLHWSIASRLVAELGAWEPPGGLHLGMSVNYKVPTFSDWIADYCFEFVRREILPNWSLEVEVPLAFEFDRFILSGHLDKLAVSNDGTESDGADWKTGRMAVDAADSNNQCLGYIVLQKRAYPMLRRASFSVVQPRANEEEGEQRISTVRVEGDDLDSSVAYLESRVNSALDNLDELNTGPRQCRWCSASLQCPAAIAERESMKMKLTPEMLAQVKREPDDALLGDWAVSARVIEQPIKDAKEMLHERIAKTGSVTAGCGVHITQTEQGGQYAVTDPIPLYTSICATLPPQEVAKVLDPSVGRLKDAVARVLNIPKTGKAAVTAESVFTERFRPFLEQGKRRIFKFS